MFTMRAISKMQMFGILSSLIIGVARAADYYVSPTGSDNDPGTLAKPFATVQRAQDAAAPGDTVFIRGGIYPMKETQIAQSKGIFAYLIFLNKSGTPGKRIQYWAYPGEKPIFDCSAVKPPQRVDAFYVSASWIHLKGLEVTGVQVTLTNHTQSIGFENDGSHNIFELLSIHDGQSIGIYSVRGSNNLFLNCDAWNNRDYTSENGKGGNADGFGCHPPKGSTNNVFRGCRAWFNSDDGFDCINAHEPVTFENCWAFYNGYSPSFKSLADGNGFKAGGYGKSPVRVPDPVPRHQIRFCLAVRNKASGFYSNHHLGGSDWLNNTAFRNGCNFNMLCMLLDGFKDVDGFGHTLKNNLSYESRALISKFDASKSVAVNNSFSLDLKLSDKDFVSIDERDLLQPRQANGDLPLIQLLHLAPGSALIDKGVDVGFPFHGIAPDLGVFEFTKE
jgi:hypothetical protein